MNAGEWGGKEFVNALGTEELHVGGDAARPFTCSHVVTPHDQLPANHDDVTKTQTEEKEGGGATLVR